VRRRPHGAPRSPFYFERLAKNKLAYILPRVAGKKKERKRKNLKELKRNNLARSTKQSCLIVRIAPF